MENRQKLAGLLSKAVLSGDRGMVARLLEQGADANENAFENCAPIFVAASLGEAGCVEELLEHTDPDLKDGCGRTPLHLAARVGDVAVLEMLSSRWATDVQDSEGETALYVAVMTGSYDAVAYLADKPGAGARTGGMTPLMWAASRGDDKSVRLLLPVSDLALTNDEGQTAQEIADKRGFRPCSDEFKKFLAQKEREQLAEHAPLGQGQKKKPKL